MGASLAQGWVRSNIKKIDVIDPNPLPTHLIPTITRYTPDIHSLSPASTPYTAIILAVKPNLITEVCTALSHRSDLCGPDTLVLSVAAGRETKSIAALLPTNTPIIRAMPNLPASVGHGITALYTSSHTPNTVRELAQRLCAAVGEVVWINDENLMDAVTALSGSGPAYLFLLIDIMANAGVTLGLPPETAMNLSRQTVIGAAHMAEQSPELSAMTLRESVTSPGGTTAAALKILMDNPKGIADLFTRALTAARDRSLELRK